MARRITHKRGLEKNLPSLDIAELGFTTDSEKLFIGGASGNVEIAVKEDLKHKANKEVVKNFPLTSTLVPDLNTNFAPYYKYTSNGDRFCFSLNMPFNTLRVGSLVIGTLPAEDRPTNTQRLPCNLTGATNEAIHAMLQISWNGTVTILPYSDTVQWKNAMSNGSIFKE